MMRGATSGCYRGRRAPSPCRDRGSRTGAGYRAISTKNGTGMESSLLCNNTDRLIPAQAGASLAARHLHRQRCQHQPPPCSPASAEHHGDHPQSGNLSARIAWIFSVFSQIRSTGLIRHRVRLSVRSSCPMDLHTFPFDRSGTTFLLLVMTLPSQAEV